MILLGRFLKVSQFSPLESSSSLVDIGPSSVDTSVGETIVAPGIGLGLGVTLSKVADTAIGVWAVDTSVGETIVAPGIGLGLSVTLSNVVDTTIAVWAVDTSVGEAIVAPGIRLGFSVTLSKVVVTAIGGVWAVDTSSVGETIAPGIGLGFGITLAKIVTIVWAGVGTSVGVGKTVAVAPGIGLGLSLALSKVKSRVEDRVDSLGGKVGGGSDLLGWGVVWGHGTIGMSNKSVLSVDSRGNHSRGSHNRGNMVDSGNTGVEEGRVRLSLSLGLTLANQVVAGGVENSWLVDNSSGVGQVLDVLLVGSQLGSGLLLLGSEVRGDCARAGVELQTSVDGADNWGNNTTHSWDTGVDQSGVSDGAGAGASKSHNSDKSLHCWLLLGDVAFPNPQ